MVIIRERLLICFANSDSTGFITVYSVDADGAYFVRMEFEAHNKGISCLVMLSEGTLLSGGERDRKIAAWDSLQNYKKITEIKVLTRTFLQMTMNKNKHFSFLRMLVGSERFTLNDQEETMETSMLAQRETTSSKDLCREDLTRLSLDMEDSFGVWLLIPRTSFSPLRVMIKILHSGDVINLFGHLR